MKQGMMLAQQDTEGWQLGCAGIDITSNVNLRMTTPQERAMFAAGAATIPDGFEEEIASRLPASIRDEAIWQCHVECQRGVVLWHLDQAFRFVLEAEWHGLFSELPDFDPSKEAVVLAQGEGAVEVFRIGPEGRLVLVRSERAPYPGSHRSLTW